MKQLKVLLIRPYSKADEIIPPLGLGYLATAIRKNHKVEILDGIKENLTIESFREILSQGGYDIIGIQMFTFHAPVIKEYVETIRAVWPAAKIILGGPHPSASPSNILDSFPGVDWAFRGEGEIGLAQLVDLIATNKIKSQDLNKIPGLIWQKDDNTIVNQQLFVANLDELGMPAWDLIRPDKYPLAPHGGFFKNYPIAPIIITRGCPFSCTYCAGHLVTGKKIRYRSVESVIEEIKLLYNKYGIKEIHIEDDNFTFDNNYVKDFCRALKSNDLDISWTCPNGVRLDSLDEETLLLMKESGLYSLSVGIESGSDRILKEMKKSLTINIIKEKIALIKKCGLGVSGFFIIGYPSETKEDIMKTIDFSLSLDLKRASFALFKPFPGTQTTKQLMEKGEIDKLSEEDWAKFVLADAVYAPSGFSREEMRLLRRRALLCFYLRPKIIFKFISEIKSPQHLLLVLKRIYSWLFKAK